MGSNWPGNVASYNWDTELLCNWDTGLSSAFGRRSGIETQASSSAETGASNPASWLCGDAEPRASTLHLGFAMTLRHELQALHLGFTMTLRRKLRALHLDIMTMLRRRFWASRLDITMTLRRKFRASHLEIAMTLRHRFCALRLDIASMIFIGLASEVWILLSDVLSLVIFRQSIELPPKFSKLCCWLGQVSKHFRLFFWQQALKTRLAIFWDTLSSVLSRSWSSWVYC